ARTSRLGCNADGPSTDHSRRAVCESETRRLGHDHPVEPLSRYRSLGSEAGARGADERRPERFSRPPRVPDWNRPREAGAHLASEDAGEALAAEGEIERERVADGDDSADERRGAQHARRRVAGLELGHGPKRDRGLPFRDEARVAEPFALAADLP